MTTTTFDAWVLSRIMSDWPVGSAIAGMSPRLQPLAAVLCGKPKPARKPMLEAFAASQEDPGAWLQSVLDVPADRPAPAREPAADPGATLADIRRLMDNQPWPWTGWLPGGALTAMASDAGIGKTLLALTMARALWTASPFPDGQHNPFPARTRTLWVPGDHHYHQLMQVAARYGIPDEAILINRPAREPIGELDLDEEVAVAALARRIEADRPGLVIVDTVGQVTARNLGRPEDARLFFQPLLTLAARTKTCFLMLTHLSREGDPLGRRIVAVSRVLWKLSQPDKEGQPDRRKLWVEKSYALKPPPLGMTIADDGCTFDDSPPAAPAKDQGGRPPVKLEDCKAWLIERLTPIPVAVKSLRSDAEEAGYSAEVLYRAHDALGLEEYIVDRRKWWKLPLIPDVE